LNEKLNKIRITSLKIYKVIMNMIIGGTSGVVGILVDNL